MQQRKQRQYQSQRIFTASEVAEFEYCPLVWWHAQYEPLVEANTDELFAHLVEMEHEHGSQATALPEYQVVEQLLVQRGAFDEGRQQHLDHALEVAEVEEERTNVSGVVSNTRRVALIALVLLSTALVCIIMSLFFSPR